MKSLIPVVPTNQVRTPEEAAIVAVPPSPTEQMRPLPLHCLAMAVAGSDVVALRSGRRVPGEIPLFPSALVIISQWREDRWEDWGFIDQELVGEISGVRLHRLGDSWNAIYTIKSPDGQEQFRCAEFRVGDKPLPENLAARPIGAWQNLPLFPVPPGRAGVLAGQCGDVLLAAGGANFPDQPPWEGGVKKYFSDIHILTPAAAAWKLAGQLPAARGYGACVSLPQGLLVLGGENTEQLFSDCLLIRWDGEKIVVDASAFPPLPFPVTSPAAACCGSQIYLAGGYTPDAPRVTRKEFLRLDISKINPAWESLESWPGPSRALAVAGVLDENFYLMSGLEIAASSGTPLAPNYLRDAYRFTSAGIWERLPELPWSAIAAPSPAPVVPEQKRLYIFGGVDGAQVGKLPREASLPNDILYFDAERDRWSLHREAWPTPVVSIPSSVAADQHWAFLTGESMPGKRTCSCSLWSPA